MLKMAKFGLPTANSREAVKTVRQAIRWCCDKRDAGNPIEHALGLKCVTTGGCDTDWVADPVLLSSVPALVLASQMTLNAEIAAGLTSVELDTIWNDYDSWNRLIQRLAAYLGTGKLLLEVCEV